MNGIFEQALRAAQKDSQKRYEDSDEAYFEKEPGDPNEYVIVNDDLFTFKWQRSKSNENINDTMTGRRCFSFYFARYVFFDPNFYVDEELATDERNTGIIGIIPGDSKEREMRNISVQLRGEILIYPCHPLKSKDTPSA
jgi:hypothetical protein